ncbi:hypothetical protein BD413DRAFT_610317 [Trametes elegans]|nr:hypothetical protein BD413DRAFT_610317 [Trametes elegans]
MDGPHTAKPEPSHTAIISVSAVSSSTLRPSAGARLCEVYDILRIILEDGFDVSLPRPLGDTNRTHLFRCALVCRTFYEAALPLIWRQLPDLTALWQLLAPPTSPIQWHREGYTGGDFREQSAYVNEIIRAKMYNDPAVWHSFLRHAAYVRRIHDESWATNPYSKNTQLLQFVVNQNNGHTIFPKLQTLEWHFDSWPHETVLAILSTIQTLILKCPRKLRFTQSIIDCLPTLSTHLETIRITGRFLYAEGEKYSWQNLEKLSSLRRLTIDYLVNGPTFLFLATMPNIVQLEVAIRMTLPSPACPPLTLGPALRDLMLKGSPRQLAFALDHIRTSSLDTLRLLIIMNDAIGGIHACFAACAAALFSGIQVRGLSIRGTYFVNETLMRDEQPPSLIHFLRPLDPLASAPLDQLTVSFRGNHGLMATDEDLLAVGHAWKGIKDVRFELSLADRGHAGHVPTVDGWQRFKSLYPNIAGLENEQRAV